MISEFKVSTKLSLFAQQQIYYFVIEINRPFTWCQNLCQVNFHSDLYNLHFEYDHHRRTQRLCHNNKTHNLSFISESDCFDNLAILEIPTNIAPHLAFSKKAAGLGMGAG
jgi:hypothetical protein